MEESQTYLLWVQQRAQYLIRKGSYIFEHGEVTLGTIKMSKWVEAWANECMNYLINSCASELILWGGGGGLARGTALRRYATSRKIASWSPDGVSEFFQFT
jgi:hypothetical protein